MTSWVSFITCQEVLSITIVRFSLYSLKYIIAPVSHCFNGISAAMTSEHCSSTSIDYYDAQDLYSDKLNPVENKPKMLTAPDTRDFSN